MSLVESIPREHPASEIRLAVPKSPADVALDPERRFWRTLATGSAKWEQGEPAETVFFGLVSGHYALVDEARTPTAVFWLMRASRQPRRGLSEVRLQRLQKAASGKQAKQVAAELAISEACLSGSVAGGLHHLGFESREELMWFCRERGTLAPPSTFRSTRFATPRGELVVAVFPRGPSEVAGPFSPAERAIVARVLSGMSNREVAVDRQVSVCTVQNQVAAVLRRAAVDSRWELIARSVAWAPSLSPPDRLPVSIMRRFSEEAWTKTRRLTGRGLKMST